MKRFTTTLITCLVLFSYERAGAQLIANAGNDTTLCSGNMALLGGNPTASFGTPPYSYSWSPNPALSCTTCPNPLAAPISTTTFMVTVTDNIGNAATDAIIVFVNPSPTADAGPDQNIFDCPDAFVTLGGSPTASGGSGNYLYSWSPSVALNNSTISNPTVGGLTTTTYFTVTVTDISTLCSATDQIFVTVIPSSLSADAGNDISVCLGASATLGGSPSVSGGSPPYIYQWTPGSGLSNPSLPNPASMPTQTTIFTLVATDILGCQAIDSITVFVGNLHIDSITGLQTQCFGNNYGNACVYPSGGSSSYSYLWNNGPTTQCVNNLYAGSYLVIVSDSSACSVSSSVIINEYPELRVDSVAMRSISCYGGNDGMACIYLSGGPPPYFYVWSNSGQGQCQSNLLPGYYNATVGDGNNCTASANGIITQPSHLNLQISADADGILPDTFCVTALGGTPPYLYDPGFNTNSFGNGCYQLVSGTFSITVTDASSCNITSSGNCAGFQIDSAVSINFPCLGSGSTGCVYPSGGTLPYHYNWSGGQTSQCIANLANGIYSPAVTVTDGNNCSGYATVNINQPPLFYIYSLYHRDDTCGLNTGWADVSVTGGTGPRTYLWSNGGTHASITNLAAGIYSVTVTDGSGCSVSSSVTIAQLPLFTTQISSSTGGILPDTLCVTVVGGTAPFNYQWSGNVNQLPNACFELLSGSFSITVTDAHGCSVTDNVYSGGTVVANAGPDITICAGDTAPFNLGGSPTANGGNPPYTYLWAPSVALSCNNCPNPQTSSLTVTTTFILTVTDNLGDTATDAVTVFVNPGPVVDSIIVTNVSCYGGHDGTACVYISGGTLPRSYLWSNAAFTSCLTNMTFGNWSVTVTDLTGCAVSASLNISEPLPFVGHIISATGGILPDTLSVQWSGGTLPYTYQWDNSTGYPAVYIIDQPGVYSVTVYDSHLCTIVDSISIGCLNHCLWPGDADYNGLADNNDLLAIGLGYGTNGPIRALQDINWYPHQSADWVDTLSSGSNYKHIDCNGNGIINADDTLAIIQNYGQTHAKTDEANGWRSTDPALYIDLLPDTTQAGDTMYATLTLGDINIQASNVYGLAFTIHYDPNVVDSSKTRATFGNSWLGTAIDKISIAKDLKPIGELKCALTRIDHTTRSGFGQIGQVEFVITTDNINGKDLAYYQMNVWVSDILMIDNLGNEITVNAGRDSSQVEFEPISVGNRQLAISNLKIQPNPANEEVLLWVTNNFIGGEIDISDIEGRALIGMLISASNIKIQTSNLANGIYFVRIRTGTGMVTRRLVIARR